MVLKGAFFHKPADAGKNYYWEHEVEVERDAHGNVIGGKLKDGTPLEYEMTTMSKSKNNGVDPQELIDRYGADTARLFVMFASPPEQTLEWNDSGVEGAHRFLKRVWAFGAKNAATLKATSDTGAALSSDAKALRREVHLVLKQVTYDYERMQYNTVVSGAMKLLNALEGFTPAGTGDAAVLREGFSVLLRALYPACPHITHALWVDLGYAAALGDLLDAPWPKVDEAALVQDEIELMLQVNGKLRGSIKVPATADKAVIETTALASPDFIKFAEGRPAKKVIVVPGRLVNVVA
jgi:leucyl-tRNA synthetase